MRKFNLTLLLTAIATNIVAADMPTAEERAQHLQGVLARADAIFSGKFRYYFTLGMEGGKEAFESDVDFSFSGESWIKRLHGGDNEGNAILSHAGKSIGFLRFRKKDGSFGGNVRILPPTPLWECDSPPPFFAGTFWSREMRHYIAENAERAVYHGKERVNGVDTVVYEWAVHSLDGYRAFVELPRSDVGATRLRLYIVPSMGFVLARIEGIEVDRGNEVFMRIDSENFEKTDGGHYFPRVCCKRGYFPGNKVFLTAYKISGIRDINGAIPDSEFVISVPDGSRVSDSRDPRGSITLTAHAKEQWPEPFKDFGQSVNIDIGSPWWRRRWFAICLGLLTGGILFGAIAAVRARLRRKGEAT